jgi:Dissimilatory sulfite reductase D (DsrD)
MKEKRNYMEIEEAKQKIVEALGKKKGKTKFYFNDLTKILDLKPRDAKKLINVLVTDGVLEYWSSGSTSMYGLKGAGKQAAAEHED